MATIILMGVAFVAGFATCFVSQKKLDKLRERMSGWRRKDEAEEAAE